MFEALHCPEIDLFASPQNAKLPLFCSRFPTAGAWAVDALTLDWSHLDAYAFLPFPLVGRVVEMVAMTSCRLILIAPFWLTQI